MVAGAFPLACLRWSTCAPAPAIAGAEPYNPLERKADLRSIMEINLARGAGLHARDERALKQPRLGFDFNVVFIFVYNESKFEQNGPLPVARGCQQIFKMDDSNGWLLRADTLLGWMHSTSTAGLKAMVLCRRDQPWK